MAKQTLAPFFIGTVDLLTFYKMHGKYFARAKSSLTADRVKTDACFIPTMQQADFLCRASKIGSILYALVPRDHKVHSLFRTLTGKANLLLKQGLEEEEILLRLIDSYIVPLRKLHVKTLVKAKKAQRKKSNKAVLPPSLRRCRRFKMIDGGAAGSVQSSGTVLLALAAELAAKGNPPPAWLFPDLVHT